MPDASTRRPVAVVIGAFSGIGRCTARLLGHRGWDVVLASRSGPVLREVARECTARGARALVVPVDVGDRVAVEDLFARAVDEFGGVAAVGPLMGVFGLSRRPTPDHPGTVLAARPAGEAERGWWDRWGRRTVPTTAVSPADGTAAAPRPGAGRRRP